MVQQRSTYPLDDSKEPAERDRQPTSAMERVKDAAAEAQEYAGKVAQQAREYGEKAQEPARDFKPFVQKSMKDQPMAPLAVGSVIGFVLGALWKK